MMSVLAIYSFGLEKQVSVTRKYRNYRSQTIPWHNEEEAFNTDNIKREKHIKAIHVIQ